MMKTYEEICEEYAKEQGHKSFYEYSSDWIISPKSYEEIAKRYAREALREAADKAKIIKIGNSGSYYDAGIDKESITNIELL